VPNSQAQTSEIELRKKYDLKYNSVKCAAYKVGVMVEFRSREGIKTGMIGKITSEEDGVKYLVSVVNNKISCIELYRALRSEIIRIVKGET